MEGRKRYTIQVTKLKDYSELLKVKPIIKNVIFDLETKDGYLIFSMKGA